MATRTALLLAALVIIGVLSRRVHQSLELADPFWLVPPGLASVFLYLRARRWTGGTDLRRRVRLDLKANTAVVHHIRSHEAILFDEREDEGPIVFVQADAGETLVLTGQDLARHVSRGFPWREFEIREAPNSGRFLGLKRCGEPLAPSRRGRPLSPESYEQLGLGAVRTWARLEVPFDHVRQVS